MSDMTPKEMAQRIGSGLLSFPITHFKDDLSVDEGTYRDNLNRLAGYNVAGLFAAGGTGEFFSLTAAEVGQVVRAAVEETKGRVPVIAPAGQGTMTAIGLAQDAEKAGADGVLLLPPYLVGGDQDGLAAHVEAVCRSTKLGVIVYNRDNAQLNEITVARLCEKLPNLVGFKDGVGDVELMTRVYATIGDRLTYIGGLPTAETFALPYLEMGVTTYSSAIFNFLPEWALSFYEAVRRRDREAVYAELRDFVLPYIALRNRGKGYAVSIVKAGMTAVGRHAGPVRPPLRDLSGAELEELKALIKDRHQPASKRTAA
ncbi:5-dehydro-4-deoxyglucarate dehydratase [Roseomonas sp. WA12]